jgi:hypothetical protein
MRGAAVCCATLGLWACVGPNFHRPEPPPVDRFTAEALPPETASAPGPGGAAQRFLMEQDVPRDWWTRFGSEKLDDLVNEALRANPSVQATSATLRQAEEKRGRAARRVLSCCGLDSTPLAARCGGRARPQSRLRNRALQSVHATSHRKLCPRCVGAITPVESWPLAEADRFQLDATYLPLTPMW